MSDTPGRKRRVFGRQSDDQQPMATPPPEPPSVNEEQTLMMGAGSGEETRFDLAPPEPIPDVEAGDPPTMPKVDGAPPASTSSSSGFPNVTEVESQSSDVGRPSKPSVRISDSRPGVPGSGSPYRPPSSSAPASSAGNSTRLSTKGKTPPQLKGYTLTDRLGAGTFGSVWRARHLRTNAEMAVKLFDQSIGADWDYLKREIETLLTVGKHPNIVTLHDADFFQEPPFYAMELMHTSMDAALRGHRKAVLANVESTEMEDHQWIPWPDLDQAAKWFEQMASGLGYVHGKAFIHCDMKPANVLLDDGDNARIVDFGQALLKGRDNVSLGTLFFMPPEQTEIEDKGKFHPDIRWDIYGLGATIYTLLAGRPPRSGKAQLRSISTAGTVKEKLNVYRVQMASTPLVPLTSIHPRISPEFASIVEKCLEIDPDKRYSSMSEIVDDIDNMRRNLPMISYRPWSRKYLAKKFLRRNALWMIPAAALLATLVISQFWIIRFYQRQEFAVVTMMNRDGESVSHQGSSGSNITEALDSGREKAFLDAISKARAAIERGQTEAALSALSTVEPTYQSWGWGRLKFLAMRHTGTGAPGPQLGVEQLSGLPRPNGFVAPSLNGFYLTVNWPYGKAEVLDSKTGIADPSFTLKGENFASLAIGSDNKTAAGILKTGQIYVRREPNTAEWVLLGNHPAAKAVAITPDLKRVVTIDGGGTVRVWVLRTGSEALSFQTPATDTVYAEFSDSETKLVLYDSAGGATLLQSLPR